MKANSEEALKGMAELLLSKAKMLQYHCDTCKSPLFKKEGKIICPICGEFKKREETDKVKKPKVDERLRATLQKKREELLKRLEEEKKPEEISALLDAIAKIDGMLAGEV
ncbi:MAG: Sjogren's syndrome/scleroderma autoantigen 1 family protein [Candidatus Hydrothermarchaeales archaeon]